MLTLRRHSIDFADGEDKQLFVHFCLDTETQGYFSSWDRLFRGEVFIKKPWIGKVNTDKNEFKVIRTRTGLLKIGVSALEICGKLTEDKKIKIKIRPVWYATLSLLWGTTFMTTIVFNYFNDIFGWAVLLSILTLQILLMLLDLRKTDERILDYIDAIRSNAPQQGA